MAPPTPARRHLPASPVAVRGAGLGFASIPPAFAAAFSSALGPLAPEPSTAYSFPSHFGQLTAPIYYAISITISSYFSYLSLNLSLGN